MSLLSTIQRELKKNHERFVQFSDRLKEKGYRLPVFFGGLVLVVILLLLQTPGSTYSAGNQPMLQLDPLTRIWPGAFGNATHDQDYYPVFSAPSVLSITNQPKGSAVTGGFPQIGSSVPEINRLFMTRFGTFASPVANEDANRLGGMVAVVLESGVSETLSEVVRNNLKQMARDPYVYQILKTYSSPFTGVGSQGDSGFFQVALNLPGVQTAYHGPVSSPPLRTKINLNEGLLVNPSQNSKHVQGTLFHELLHYFYDRLEYHPDLINSGFELFTEHAYTDPVAYRLSLISNIHNLPGNVLSVLSQATNDAIQGFGHNLQRSVTSSESLSAKMREMLLNPTIQSQQEEGKELRKESRSYLVSYFYGQFVDQQMQYLRNADPQKGRSSVFYQNVAYMWAYYVAIYKESVYLALSMLDMPCFGSLNGESKVVYLKKHDDFVSRLSDALYNDGGLSVRETAEKIMNDIIDNLDGECQRKCSVK